VDAKGKGKLRTYWLRQGHTGSCDTTSTESVGIVESAGEQAPEQKNLSNKSMDFADQAVLFLHSGLKVAEEVSV
jgi:hypothetical protein